MSSHKLLLRIFMEQCVTENGEDGGERIQVGLNKEIASYSLHPPTPIPVTTGTKGRDIWYK